jgi:4-amino-4-deoxy-L-arabinose transferase-like glycosyltransferase
MMRAVTVVVRTLRRRAGDDGSAGCEERPGSGRSGRDRDPRWSWPVVALIAVAAGITYGWGAGHSTIEIYYAGAVRTMATSWHAFAFGGFDPAGTITLDKLPGSFWIQALVVRAFGLSTWTLVMPQIVAGALTVVAMFVATRRVAGPRTGIVAAAITAAVPATAIMSRGNTADAICVLLLVVAADATLRSIGNGRLRTVVLAGTVVGFAFQAKMIEAWAVLPAFGLAYVIAAPGSVSRRLGRLAIAGVVTIAVSLSWMTAVTLVPAADRPYVDGSRHDSVYEQVFAYNGVYRFGAGSTYGLGTGLPYTPSAQARAHAAEVGRSHSPSADSSRPGLTRLVTGEVGRDAGWLLPVALVAMIGLVIARRHRPRTDIVRAAVIVWGVWLITFMVLFSRAAVVLTYYTGVLVSPIAALCAIGLRTAYRAMRQRRAHGAAMASALVFLIGVAGVAVLGWRTPAWFQIVVAAVALGGGLLIATARRRRHIVTSAALTASARAAALTVAALTVLLVPPAVATTALVADDGGSFDAPFPVGGTLAHPAARFSTGGIYGGVVVPQMTAARWSALDDLRQGWDRDLTADRRLAIFTSAQAAQFVLAGIAHVEPIGGYTGLVNSPSLDQVDEALAAGAIAFAIVPGPDDLRARDPRIQAIENHCRTNSFAAGPISAAGPAVYFCG